MADLLPQVSQGRGRPAESGDDAASVAVSANGLQEVSSFGRSWVGHLGTNSFGRQAGPVASELVPPDAFQVRLRGYVSRSVRTFPSRPPKEPS